MEKSTLIKCGFENFLPENSGAPGRTAWLFQRARLVAGHGAALLLATSVPTVLYDHVSVIGGVVVHLEDRREVVGEDEIQAGDHQTNRRTNAACKGWCKT
jgi:hypothetical protein